MVMVVMMSALLMLAECESHLLVFFLVGSSDWILGNPLDFLDHDFDWVD
jgi:hypothetical protein